MTYDQLTEAQQERACIMHYDGGLPWDEAVRRAGETAKQ